MKTIKIKQYNYKFSSHRHSGLSRIRTSLDSGVVPLRGTPQNDNCRIHDSAQRGSVSIIAVIIIVAILLFWQIYNKQSELVKTKIANTSTSTTSSGPICRPDNETNPPMVTAFDYECTGGDGRCVGIFDGQGGRALRSIEYVRIKKDVPVPQHAFNGSYCDNVPTNRDNGCVEPNDRHFIEKGTISVGGRQYALYYPDGDKGNISYDFVGQDGGTKYIELAKYKFIYLVQLIPGQNAGQYTTNRKYSNIAGHDPEQPRYNKRYWITDIYMAKSLKDTLPQDILLCKDKQLAYSGPTSAPVHGPAGFSEVVIPTQAVSGDGKQLQLQYVTFKPEVYPDRGTDQAWWTPHCKPVIYLYPEQKQTVSVKLNPKGFLIETIPTYPKDGWVVTAYPDGTISSGNKTYDYLYYESAIADSETKVPSKGFVKRPEELESFFADILPRLGLNQKEAKEFSDYWRKALPKAQYYFIGIMDTPSINYIDPLTISPKPDSILRVRFYFKALDNPITVTAPVLPRLSPRSGFTVVEWGGMVKRDPNHPFTCSE